MSASMPSPLSAEIKLPAAFHEVINEYKKAISLVKKELREVEAEAKEILKTRGITDEVLERKAKSLRDIQGGLEMKVQEQTRQKQQDTIIKEEDRHRKLGDEIEEDATNRELKKLRTYLDFKKEQKQKAADEKEEQHQAIQNIARKSGMTGDMAEGYADLLSKPLEKISNVGQMLKAVGAAKTGAAVESAAAGAAKTIGGVLANPYVAIALIAAGVVERFVSLQNESNKAQGLASIATAADFTRLSGGGASKNVLDAGSAGRAIRIRNDQVRAQHEGIEDSARGIGEFVANAMGFNTADQINAGEVRRQFESKKEEVRQKFGIKGGEIKLNAIDEKMVQRKIDQMERDPAYIAKRAAYMLTALSPAARLLGIQGEEEIVRMERETRAKAVKEITEGKMGALEARRNTEEVQWNLGVQGALNRVMENEKRRWLRAVEVDRSARFNSWSLT